MKSLPRHFLVPLLVIILGTTLAACGGSPTLTVNTTDDVDDGACNTTHCSLREAIRKANTLAGMVTIRFDIGGGGVQTIQPKSYLPDIFATVLIDGTTQPGFAGMPLIELDGTLAGVADGLTLRGNDSTVKGLVINRFSRDGIRIRAERAVIKGNYIGTDITGTVGLGNGANGINVCCEFTAPPHATIGGVAPEDRNIVSANASGGITLDQHYPGFTHEGRNLVIGNFIGTDVTGTVALGNQWDGILIDDSGYNAIGGTTDGAGNVISANHLSGVAIAGGFAKENVVQGNLIGTDLTGSVGLGNLTDGVNIVGSNNNLIGGSDPGARNVVSANQLRGVRIDGSSSGIKVFGNFIGTNAAGTAALKNVKAGIVVDGADHTIGSPDDGNRNLISGNGGPGIAVLSTATGILIQNNFIGTDISGMSVLGNRMGVEVGMGSGATGVQIGGGSPALALNEGNLISGNLEEGILLFNHAKVWGNKIGTDAAGTGPLGNGGNGILVKGSGNQIGGPGSGNTIAFNGKHGVAVISESGSATQNAIQVNQIHDNAMLGIAIDENAVLPNDSLDPDAGDNDRQNYPIVQSAVVDLIAGTTTIEGELDSKPNTAYSVEFFSNAACDPSGFGEGESMFNKIMLTTDSQGHAQFSETTLSTSFLGGNFFTVTATDPGGNTSGFSNCVAMTELPAKAAATDAPEAMTFKPLFDPAEIFYGPRCAPDKVRISVEIGNPPEPISYVLLFVRLMDRKTGEKTAWGGGLSMIAAGKDIFYYDLLAYDVPEYDTFETAWLQYQFVVYNKAQEKIGYSEVYGDIAFSRCGSNSARSTSTPDATGK
ncbi:MAG: CSLREA domain-containing protein [Anaerolineales bacterium]|nr:CSLREA domain-containing protein [Anaerolineales bacterium]